MLALINDSKQYGFRQNNRFISLDCIHYSNGNTFFHKILLRKKNDVKNDQKFRYEKTEWSQFNESTRQSKWKRFNSIGAKIFNRRINLRDEMNTV